MGEKDCNENGSIRDEEEMDWIERLKAELNSAFAAPDSAYEPLTVAEVIARNQT